VPTIVQHFKVGQDRVILIAICAAVEITRIVYGHIAVGVQVNALQRVV
jgi:hypothetical protein